MAGNLNERPQKVKKVEDLGRLSRVVRRSLECLNRSEHPATDHFLQRESPPSAPHRRAIYTGDVVLKEAIRAVGNGRWQDVPTDLDTRSIA